MEFCALMVQSSKVHLWPFIKILCTLLAQCWVLRKLFRQICTVSWDFDKFWIHLDLLSLYYDKYECHLFPKNKQMLVIFNGLTCESFPKKQQIALISFDVRGNTIFPEGLLEWGIHRLNIFNSLTVLAVYDGYHYVFPLWLNNLILSAIFSTRN